MKYSSLFTHPSQTPINRAFGKVKSRLNSSPLFTQVSATTHKGGIQQIQLPHLLFLPEFDEQISLFLLDQREIRKHFRASSQIPGFVQFFMLLLFFKIFPDGWRVVKSGEELSLLFTLPNALFIGVGEGWVKSIWQKNLPLHTRHYPPSLHSISHFSEYDCKSNQFARRFQLFTTIPLHFSCKWGKRRLVLAHFIAIALT